MISINNLSKSYGAQDLFESVNFKVNEGERIGLVGRNGHGKSTLFKIIAGLEAQDSGEILIPKSYKIGYLEQELNFSKESVLEEAATSLPKGEETNIWKAEKILSGLGFTETEFDISPSKLSGGFQIRLNLAKLLLSEPNLLLLDEPNNYLDVTSIRWLANFLNSWPAEIILITHDRSFMDKVVTHTMAIHRQKLKKIKGDTSKLYDQIAQEEEIYEKTRLNDEKKRKEVELFITRFRAKARLANMVQSRIKQLKKLEKKEKLQVEESLDFSFSYKPFQAKVNLSTDDLTFGYEKDHPLIEGLSLSISPGDRVCVVGKNGKGKTTLLKLLAGALEPQNGEIKYHPSTAVGYYEQTNIKDLNPANTVLDEIQNSANGIDLQRARNLCGLMMFTGDNALKKINVLSGGEKSRVLIGKTLAAPHNTLLLDEPTNHLDMDSTDSLLAAIDDFPGSVIMVTHNEMFLHALATKLVVFQGGKVTVYNGDYQRFLDNIGWEDEEKDSKKEKSQSDKLSKKDLRRLKSEIRNKHAAKLKPLEMRIEELEKQIETYETELKELTAALVEASEQKDSGKISVLSQTLSETEKIIESLFEGLEITLEEYEEKKVSFEKEMEEFE